MTERVLVAMSGGVDSSVAAARLVDAGLEVIGVTLHLWDYPDVAAERGRCCAPEDVHDARRVAEALGFPHYAFDRRAEFLAEVVTPFADAYLAGETPSPCVRCNRGVKLRELARLADRLGAVRIATGHYARRRGERLARARDLAKDQSYFLHATPPELVRRLEFPLAESTKAEVRAEAVSRGLPGAEKGESQELCFVADGRYTAVVEAHAAGRVRPGPILGPDGAEVGRHAGIHGFTLGQRRNLGVALGRPAWVVDIEPASGAVRLGERDALRVARVALGDVHLAPGVSLPLRARAALRYRAAETPVELTRDGEGRVVARFDPPAGPAAPGQFLVLYDDDGTVLGGGLIQAPPRGAAGRAPSEVRP